MPAAFEFDDSASTARRSRQPGGPSWLSSCSSTFTAVLLAGILLLVGVRLYLHWSIADAFEKLKNPPAKVAK
jgi:hypothetical protein